MFAPGSTGGGAGWANEVERWLLFRCRNSQERSSVPVREGPVHPILAAASLPTVCRGAGCNRDERLRPVLAARRGQPRSRRGGHVRRRAGWVLQLRGEILLQIRCRCSEAQSPLQFVIAAGQRARGIEDAPTSAYAAVVLNWTLAGRTPAMRVLSRLDVRPTKKYTSALS